MKNNLISFIHFLLLSNTAFAKGFNYLLAKIMEIGPVLLCSDCALQLRRKSLWRCRHSLCPTQSVARSFKYRNGNDQCYFAYGLHFLNPKSNQFEIAGAGSVFYEATATIKNNNVVLQSDKVKNPVKVCFAWKNNAQSVLFKKANLPASSFKTE